MGAGELRPFFLDRVVSARWTKDIARNWRPPSRLNHPFVTDSAFDWPSSAEEPRVSYKDRSRAHSPRVARTADYLEAVNLLEEFDDVENAALDEVERFQASRRRAPMLDELDDD
jgi:hypothetical protein